MGLAKAAINNFGFNFEWSYDSRILPFFCIVISLGVPNSHCYGSVIQGVFQGTIHLPDETYHIEKSKRFFNDAPVFHSVIYRESDMNLDPFKERRERERREANVVGSCGNDRVREWMRDVGRSEVVKPNRAARVRISNTVDSHMAPDKRKYIRKILLFLHKNICCWFSLEEPCWGASNEYHNIGILGDVKEYY